MSWVGCPSFWNCPRFTMSYSTEMVLRSFLALDIFIQWGFGWQQKAKLNRASLCSVFFVRSSEIFLVFYFFLGASVESLLFHTSFFLAAAAKNPTILRRSSHWSHLCRGGGQWCRKDAGAFCYGFLKWNKKTPSFCLVLLDDVILCYTMLYSLWTCWRKNTVYNYGMPYYTIRK